MSTRGAEWYKREPRAFLEGVRRMTEREIAVYAVVLDLIYDGGHETLDDPKHIASYFSDLGVAAVRNAIERLISAGKLDRNGEYLTNKRARNEGRTREELTETRRKAGRSGGVSSGKSRRNSNKNNAVAKANAALRVREDKIREDIDKIDVDKSTSSAANIAAEFEQDFWPAYPKRQAKGAALRAYKAARKKATLADILAGVTRYASDRRNEDPRYTKAAASWLNGACWLDEPTGARGSSDWRDDPAYAGVE